MDVLTRAEAMKNLVVPSFFDERWPSGDGPFGKLMAKPMADAWEYWVDSCQRSVLFWDVMRKREKLSLEHSEKGKPPVLVFDYEMLMDGRTLERPVNYALLRILPEPGAAFDPKKRPFVVVDPRVGHGPGIGGSAASEPKAPARAKSGNAKATAAKPATRSKASRGRVSA